MIVTAPMEPPPPHKQRARAVDVASAAGVSQSAVSRSFTPGASVSPALKAKVLRTAKLLNYRPNAMARAVNTRRSNVYGILIATDTSLQYPEILAELSRAVAVRGKGVMLFTLDSVDAVSSVIDQMWSYQVDGVIALVGLSDDLIAQFQDHGIPIVLFNRSAPGASSVACDQQQCGRELAQRLLALGHRRFGLIDGPGASTVSAERMAGVEAALAEAASPAGRVPPLTPPPRVVVRAQGDYSYASGHAAMAVLLSGERPTAVIAASDMMALGAMDYARLTRGLAVPAAVSVAGFDGIGAGRWASFGLATMRQPIRRLADAAVSVLVERQADATLASERRILPGSFVEGDSIGPA